MALDVLGHDDVLRVGRDHVARLRIDGEVDVGEDPPVRAGARDEPPVDPAVVGPVRVPCDEHVHLGIGAPDDVDDRPGDPFAFAEVARLPATLVQDDDDRLDPLRAQGGDEPVDRRRLVLEPEAGGGRPREKSGRALERHADEGDLGPRERSHRVRREDRPVVLAMDVGREEGEVRSAEAVAVQASLGYGSRRAACARPLRAPRRARGSRPRSGRARRGSRPRSSARRGRRPRGTGSPRSGRRPRPRPSAAPRREARRGGSRGTRSRPRVPARAACRPGRASRALGARGSR